MNNMEDKEPIKSNRRIAIIGAGPMGLCYAQQVAALAEALAISTDEVESAIASFRRSCIPEPDFSEIKLLAREQIEYTAPLIPTIKIQSQKGFNAQQKRIFSKDAYCQPRKR